jgi:hypothetical protein
LRQWLTRPPCGTFELELAEASQIPNFQESPFLKHFLVALFIMGLVVALISQFPELALTQSDIGWALFLGLLYFAQGLAGRELVYDPKQTFAGNSFYNEWGCGIVVMAVFPVVMTLCVRPDFATFLPVGPDWLIVGLLLVLQHWVSIYRAVFGPLPIKRISYLAVAMVVTVMVLWHL